MLITIYFRYLPIKFQLYLVLRIKAKLVILLKYFQTRWINMQYVNCISDLIYYIGNYMKKKFSCARFVHNLTLRKIVNCFLWWLFLSNRSRGTISFLGQVTCRAPLYICYVKFILFWVLEIYWSINMICGIPSHCSSISILNSRLCASNWVLDVIKYKLHPL